MEWNVLWFSLLTTVLFISTVFALARKIDRYDVIDIAWGLAFIAVAVISFTNSVLTSTITVQLIVTIIVTAWGMRLALHIYGRWANSSEDKRYYDMRRAYQKKRGGVAVNMYVRVFLLQALVAVIISLPVIIINGHAQLEPTGMVWVGVLCWAAGFFFEAGGDYQLKQFIRKSANKGRLMTSGLWRYTRHPNYFGEIVQWWSIWGIAVVVAPSLWWISALGPIVITTLLLFVTGIPLTEKHFKGRPGWAEYKRRTSVFIPLPPKG